MKKRSGLGPWLVAALVVLLLVGLWQTSREQARGRVGVVRRPERIMGTSCTLAAVAQRAQQAQAEVALRDAENTLRALEARMSNWLDDSEISRFNQAPANTIVPLSAPSMAVLRAASQAAHDTQGAFDTTCRPLIELWRDAAAHGAPPSATEIEQARAASHWGGITLHDDGAEKTHEAMRVDLDGIAKGYAVDRAADTLRKHDLLGGMVEVGGDLVCFGLPVEAEHWTADVQNPFGGAPLLGLRFPGGAMCTSGNYARYVEIDGVRYSHILDPRTGRPIKHAPSVTVIAGDALTADIWSTALSVLGETGLGLLPSGTEALLVIGDADSHRLVCTPGFQAFIADAAPTRLEVWQP